MKRLIILFLFIFVISLVSSLPHGSFPSFASHESRLVVSDTSLFVSDTIVYNIAYYSVDGDSWSPLSLSGVSHPSASDWLLSSASASIPVDTRYLVVYSCSLSGTNNGISSSAFSDWDCHGRTSQEDGFWQLYVLSDNQETLTKATIQIDFGNNEEIAGWNLLSSTDDFLSNLKTSYNQSTGVSISFPQPFNSTSSWKGASLTSLGYPSSVSDSQFVLTAFNTRYFRQTSMYALTKISGLDTKRAYNITIFPSRDGEGVGGIRHYTNFSINNHWIRIDAAENTVTVAFFENVIPDANGDIILNTSLTFDDASKIVVLNALIIDGYFGVKGCVPESNSCGSFTCGSTTNSCGQTVFCGSCSSGSSCQANNCVADDYSCTPDCNGKSCGDDGCGGSCGSCSSGYYCSSSSCYEQGDVTYGPIAEEDFDVSDIGFLFVKGGNRPQRETPLDVRLDNYPEMYDDRFCIGGCGLELHVDIVNGDDANTGSQSSPFKTIDRVLSAIESYDFTNGEVVVYLYDGVYDPFTLYAPCGDVLFDEWVTFIAAPNNNPHIGYSGSSYSLSMIYTGCARDDTAHGSADVNARFIGVIFDDGLSTRQVRNVELIGCRMTKQGPLTGSIQYIDNNAGVSFYSSGNILLEDSEITRTGFGVSLFVHDSIIRNNHIHHISHDGIGPHGGSNVLIEGNVIHNLDDGVGDNEYACLINGYIDFRTKSSSEWSAISVNEAYCDYRDNDGACCQKIAWNRHADGIHMYPVYGCSDRTPGSDTCFRINDSDTSDNAYYSAWSNINYTITNNIIYHAESMGMMMQYKLGSQGVNIRVENNIFGPSGGYLIHNHPSFLGHTFIHNSIIYVENDAYEGLFTMHYPDGYAVDCATSDFTKEYCYNNILVGTETCGADADRYSHNLYYFPSGVSGSCGLSIGSLTSNDIPFQNPTAYDGILKSNSVAIDAGSRINNNWDGYFNENLYDIYGTLRDNRPDMGAYEVPNRNPASEELPLPIPSNPAFFVTDFSNGYFAPDPYVNSQDTTGLSWVRPYMYRANYFILDSSNNDFENSYMKQSLAGGEAFIHTQQKFSDFSFSFKIDPLQHDTGAMVLLQQTMKSDVIGVSEDFDFYGVDFKDKQLIRYANGIRTDIGSFDFSASEPFNAAVRVKSSGSAITFEVFVEGNSVYSYSETNSAMVSLFSSSGHVGFFQDYDYVADASNNNFKYYSTLVDDIVVEDLS